MKIRTTGLTRRDCFMSGSAAFMVTVLAPSLSRGASAQSTDWPTRFVRFIVPYPAGGPVDVTARLIAKALSDSLGQRVIVENRPGGSGIIGTTAVARAEPDGYTFGIILDAHTINPTIFDNIPFDPEKDFQPVSLLTEAPMIVATGAASPYKTFKDVMEVSKREPNKVTYGVSRGTLGSLMLSQLQSLGKFKLLFVSYAGAAPALTDALGGQIDVVVGLPNIILPQIRAGTLRGLGISTLQRWPRAPEIPTFVEQGFPGFSITGWVGLVAPVGTPQPIVEKINGKIRHALEDQKAVEFLAQQGMAPAPDTPDQFKEMIHDELIRWANVAKESM
jgi:tripartite-type tricarboxylate transporter receptor subunit TctC